MSWRPTELALHLSWLRSGIYTEHYGTSHAPPSWTSTLVTSRTSVSLSRPSRWISDFLWLLRRACSATLNTYGSALLFNYLWNHPPLLGEHRCFLTCYYPMRSSWVTRPQTLIQNLSGNNNKIILPEATPRTGVLKNQLTCGYQRYIRGLTRNKFEKMSDYISVVLSDENSDETSTKVPLYVPPCPSNRFCLGFRLFVCPPPPDAGDFIPPLGLVEWDREEKPRRHS